MKKVLLLILLVIIFAGLIYFFVWYAKVQKVYKQSKTITMDYDQLANMQEIIQNEYDRCQSFISQQQGDFGSFEYCKKYLEWSKENQLIRP